MRWEALFRGMSDTFFNTDRTREFNLRLDFVLCFEAVVVGFSSGSDYFCLSLKLGKIGSNMGRVLTGTQLARILDAEFLLVQIIQIEEIHEASLRAIDSSRRDFVPVF